MRHVLIAALLLTSSPAMPSPAGKPLPPFKQTCAGVLTEPHGAEALFLDTGNYTEPNKDGIHVWQRTFDHERDIICRTPITDKRLMLKVLKVCKIGAPCQISGRMKDYYRDNYDWIQIDSAKRYAETA